MESSKKITRNFIEDYISNSTQAALDFLQGEIDILPSDSDVVHNTGNETIGGIKTFTLVPVAPGFKTPSGLASQFLKADGSTDGTVYLTTESDTLQLVTNRGNVTTTPITANSFVKTGGTSAQFLKANGTVDSNVYLTAEVDTLQLVTNRGAVTTTSLTANSFIKTGGTAAQFLKANGTVDTTNYQPLLINPVTGTGTSNRLVKWLTTTQTGNSLLYDNGTNVGIGTTSPTTPLYITNASGTQLTLDATATASRLDMSLGGVALGRLQYDTSNGILLGTNTANHITFLINNGTVGRINGTTSNFTIGNVTDNAVDKLQVVGSISATSATFTAGNVTLGATTVTENRLKLNSYQSSTGITSFGAGGIAITSGTTFDVAAVTGFIVSSTDPLNIPPIPVNYPGATGLTTPYIGSAAATYLLVDSSNALVMLNTRPTTTQRRNMIYIGVIGHSAGTLGGVGNSPDIIMNEMSQVRAMFEPTKLINENIRCYNNSTNLTLANTAGKLYGFGIGFITNGNDAPSVLNIAAGTPTTFQYRTQTGVSTGNLTSIIPGSYDVGGTVTAIPVTGTRFSNQRIYILENGAIRIQYGQVLYYTLVEAVSGADKESFTAFPNNFNLGLLIGILSVSKSCTDLSNTDQARFLPVNKFGETIGASSGQAGGYLLASLTSSANVDQLLTNTISTIAFDTDDNTAYGGISRSGSSFTILSSGNYQFIIQPQVTQNVNNNVTTIWCRKNGVNVPRSAVRSEVAAAGDEFILPLVVTADLIAGDVITFHGITSAVNGSTLEFTAAAGVIPDIPAAILDIKGWKK